MPPRHDAHDASEHLRAALARRIEESSHEEEKKNALHEQLKAATSHAHFAEISDALDEEREAEAERIADE